MTSRGPFVLAVHVEWFVAICHVWHLSIYILSQMADGFFRKYIDCCYCDQHLDPQRSGHEHCCHGSHFWWVIANSDLLLCNLLLFLVLCFHLLLSLIGLFVVIEDSTGAPYLLWITWNCNSGLLLPVLSWLSYWNHVSFMSLSQGFRIHDSCSSGTCIQLPYLHLLWARSL